MSDLRPTLRYLRQVGAALLRGRRREAGAFLRGAAHRAGEAIAGPFRSQRVACGLCGWRGHRFRTFVIRGHLRRDAECPRCESLERHRDFIDLLAMLRPGLPHRLRLLDIAPARGFTLFCRRDEGIDYLSIDLSSKLAMVRMDAQRMDLDDDRFDVVVCSHVLDYVEDDRAAMREIRRVLKPRGLGILQENVRARAPTEEWSAPRGDRLDRRRQYGGDFPDRLREAGLNVLALRRRSASVVFLVSPTTDVLERIRQSLDGKTHPEWVVRPSLVRLSRRTDGRGRLPS